MSSAASDQEVDFLPGAIHSSPSARLKVPPSQKVAVEGEACGVSTPSTACSTGFPVDEARLMEQHFEPELWSWCFAVVGAPLYSFLRRRRAKFALELTLQILAVVSAFTLMKAVSSGWSELIAFEVGLTYYVTPNMFPLFYGDDCAFASAVLDVVGSSGQTCPRRPHPALQALVTRSRTSLAGSARVVSHALGLQSSRSHSECMAVELRRTTRSWQSMS
eukprot:s3363_g12.t1